MGPVLHTTLYAGGRRGTRFVERGDIHQDRPLGPHEDPTLLSRLHYMPFQMSAGGCSLISRLHGIHLRRLACLLACLLACGLFPGLGLPKRRGSCDLLPYVTASASEWDAPDPLAPREPPLPHHLPSAAFTGRKGPSRRPDAWLPTPLSGSSFTGRLPSLPRPASTRCHRRPSG
ncbi:hypothetical protein F4780DRAFT_491209 [Xylariomycetidae sp. FL0641]|nr:hypothetical protein F4780DRAFT_491209 [Xylariomycetidae sp. FL0641]